MTAFNGMVSADIDKTLPASVIIELSLKWPLLQGRPQCGVWY